MHNKSTSKQTTRLAGYILSIGASTDNISRLYEVSRRLLEYITDDFYHHQRSGSPKSQGLQDSVDLCSRLLNVAFQNVLQPLNLHLVTSSNDITQMGGGGDGVSAAQLASSSDTKKLEPEGSNRSASSFSQCPSDQGVSLVVQPAEAQQPFYAEKLPEVANLLGHIALFIIRSLPTDQLSVSLLSLILSIFDTCDALIATLASGPRPIIPSTPQQSSDDPISSSSSSSKVLPPSPNQNGNSPLSSLCVTVDDISMRASPSTDNPDEMKTDTSNFTLMTTLEQEVPGNTFDTTSPSPKVLCSPTCDMEPQLLASPSKTLVQGTPAPPCPEGTPGTDSAESNGAADPNKLNKTADAGSTPRHLRPGSGRPFLVILTPLHTAAAWALATLEQTTPKKDWCSEILFPTDRLVKSFYGNLFDFHPMPTKLSNRSGAPSPYFNSRDSAGVEMRSEQDGYFEFDGLGDDSAQDIGAEDYDEEYQSAYSRAPLRRHHYQSSDSGDVSEDPRCAAYLKFFEVGARYMLEAGEIKQAFHLLSTGILVLTAMRSWGCLKSADFSSPTAGRLLFYHTYICSLMQLTAEPSHDEESALLRSFSELDKSVARASSYSSATAALQKFWEAAAVRKMMAEATSLRDIGTRVLKYRWLRKLSQCFTRLPLKDFQSHLCLPTREAVSTFVESLESDNLAKDIRCPFISVDSDSEIVDLGDPLLGASCRSAAGLEAWIANTMATVKRQLDGCQSATKRLQNEIQTCPSFIRRNLKANQKTPSATGPSASRRNLQSALLRIEGGGTGA